MNNKKESKHSRGSRVERELLTHIRSKEIATSKSDVADSWNQIQNEGKKRERYIKYRKVALYVSTSAAVILGILFYLNIFNTAKDEQSRSIYADMIKSMSAESEEVILQRSSKEQIALSSDSLLAYDVKGRVISNSVELFSADDEAEITYDRLVVPKGKRMQLVLPDNSKLWINSNSKVIYPTRFLGDTREIFVEGEVYLEVSHNEELPFIVKTADFDIKVLGTSFNVCAYRESSIEQSVVLVDGKVDVKHTVGGDAIKLAPNQKVTIKGESISSIYAVNAHDYISWINDYLVLKSETLESVLDRLSVIYDREYEIDNSIRSLTISGKLDIKQDYETIIKTLSAIAPIPIKVSYDENEIARIVRK